jgi:outer membrane protein
MALALVTFALAMPGARAADGAGAGSAAEGSLSLERCLLIALERNPQLASSRQDVVGAEAALTRARSSYYPQVSIAGEERIGSSGLADGGDGTERTEEVDLVARQTLWRSGLRESVRESGARLSSARLRYSGAVQSLLEQVAGDYYAVLAAGRLVGVAEAGVDSASRHLREVQARIEVGVAAEVDEFTAQDDLARAELELIDARSNVRVARARLKTTMGVSPEALVELAEPPPVDEVELPRLEDALATAQQNRPDVLSARTGVEAGRSALRQARIRRGPVTEISGWHEWGYTDWTRRDPSWTAALSLSWPLLDGNATAADVVSARASLARSEAELQSVINNAGLDVETALVEVEWTRERVTASAKSVAAAGARLKAAEGRYQQGVGILLEVIQARAALTSALAGQVRAQYDYRVALVGLERALGTLSAPAAESG